MAAPDALSPFHREIRFFFVNGAFQQPGNPGPVDGSQYRNLAVEFFALRTIEPEVGVQPFDGDDAIVGRLSPVDFGQGTARD